MPSFSVPDDKWSSPDCLSLPSQRRVLTKDEQQADEFTSRTCSCGGSFSCTTPHVLSKLPTTTKTEVVNGWYFETTDATSNGWFLSLKTWRNIWTLHASTALHASLHESMLSTTCLAQHIGFAISTKNIVEKRVCISTSSKNSVPKQTGVAQRNVSKPTVLLQPVLESILS